MPVICRILFAAWIASVGVCAQYRGLAVTPDGETVYFSTALRQRGTDQPKHGKIFRVGPRGLELVRSVDLEQIPLPVSSLEYRTNYYDLRAPILDSFGDLVGVIARQECSSPNRNICTAVATSVVAGDRIYNGTLTARNARFVLISRQMNSFEVWAHQLVDLGKAPGASWTSRYYSWSALLSDGTVFYWNYQQLFRRGGGVTDDPVAGVPAATAGWAHPTTPILYVATGRADVQGWFADWSVIEIDGATLARRSHAGTHPESCRGFRNVMGRLVAACRTKVGEPEQIWQGDDAMGTGWRAITADPSGVSEFAVAERGRYAWYTNGREELKRIDMFSGRDEMRLGAVTRLDGPIAFSPGERRVLSGTGLDAPGLRLYLNDQELLILRRSARQLEVIAPWELALGPGASTPLAVRLAGTADSPFEVDPPEGVGEHRTPSWLTGTEPFRELVAHQDWRADVTAADPARPGEILHLFATGLGFVNGPIRTGEAAPLDSLRPLASPLSCTCLGGDATVLFAGLAPGTLGYYQVSIRLPAVASGNAGGLVTAMLVCQGMRYASIPVLLPPSP